MTLAALHYHRDHHGLPGPGPRLPGQHLAVVKLVGLWEQQGDTTWRNVRLDGVKMVLKAGLTQYDSYMTKCLKLHIFGPLLKKMQHTILESKDAISRCTIDVPLTQES
jgi:hypothetical protein